MIVLSFLIACLASVSAQVRPIDSRFDRTAGSEWKHDRPPRSVVKVQGAVIENKNVNIIVNVDPKDVAKELWQLIQSRLDERQGRRLTDGRGIVEELEKIVTPVVRPTRRSQKPSAFEVAYALDHVTRKALISDRLDRPTMEDEIVTRDVVALMMAKLKKITRDEENDDEKMYRPAGTRRMLQPEEHESRSEADEKDDQFVMVRLKIQKSELLKITRHISDDES